MKETIIKIDLKKANKNISKDLLDLSDSIEAITSSINGFVSDTTTELTGRGYDAVREKLSGFSLAIERLSVTLFNSSESVFNINNYVSSAMQGAQEVIYSQEDIDNLTYKIDHLRVEDFLFYTGTEESPLDYKLEYNRALEAYNNIKKPLEEKRDFLVKVKAAVDAKSGESSEIISSFSKDQANIDALSVSNIN